MPDLPTFTNGGVLLAITVLIALAILVFVVVDYARHSCQECGAHARRLYVQTDRVLVGPFCSSKCAETAYTALSWPFGRPRNLVTLDRQP